MKCYYCKGEMIWGGDHDWEEGDYSMVSNFSCPDCGSYMEFFYPSEETENDGQTPDA